jgi:TonB family protein
MTIRSDAAWFVILLALAIPALAQEDSSPVETVDSETDRMPVHTIVPEYPEAARRERIEGEVQVCFDITRAGKPRRIAVRRSSHRYFEKSARDAVRRSTWRPIPRPEKVPNIKACRTFRFTLVPVETDLD